MGHHLHHLLHHHFFLHHQMTHTHRRQYYHTRIKRTIQIGIMAESLLIFIRNQKEKDSVITDGTNDFYLSEKIIVDNDINPDNLSLFQPIKFIHYNTKRPYNKYYTIKHMDIIINTNEHQKISPTLCTIINYNYTTNTATILVPKLKNPIYLTIKTEDIKNKANTI